MFHGGGNPTPAEVKNAVIDKVISDSDRDVFGRAGKLTDEQRKVIRKNMQESLNIKHTSCDPVKGFNKYWDCKVDMIDSDNDISSSIIRVMRDSSGKLIYIKETNQ